MTHHRTDLGALDSVDEVYRLVRRRIQPGVGGVAEPAAAAAVVPWRRDRDGGVQVFLVRRSRSLSFMPGYWTAPGGRVEPGDAAAAGDGGELDDASHIAAAVRELAEETGYTAPADPARFVYAGRWVTPDLVPIRFDTRFYLHEVPADAVLDAAASGGELDADAWIAPAEALARWRDAAWPIPHPARFILTALVEISVADDAAAAGARCVAIARAQADAPRLWEHAPGVAVCPVRTPTLPPATHTNCYVIGDAELVVIDPASPHPEERAALDEALDGAIAAGRRVVEIWLTHHHLDHVSGAAHLAARLGVPVAAHPRTAERLAETVPALTVSRALADGDVQQLAGDTPRRLRVVYTPGHAPGHLCFLEEHTGFLVAGDMVAGVGTILIDPSEGDMAVYLDSLARMKSLAPSRLLPAHGPVILEPAALIDAYVAHRLWREQRVVEALARGPGPARELVAIAYDDVPSAIHGLAARSLVSHLHKLAAEGRASEREGTWHAAQ